MYAHAVKAVQYTVYACSVSG